MKSKRPYSQDSITILKAMLSQLKKNDLLMASVIRKELSKGDKEKKRQDLNKEIIRRLRIQNNKLQERRDTLKEFLKQLKLNRNQLLNRLENLRKTNKNLSDALGSCRICWGEDLHCPHCKGCGIPGWRTVNRTYYNKYVLPAIEKVNNTTK